MKPARNDRTPPDATHLLKPYLLENRYRILLGVLCLIAVDILQLYIPRIIKWAVDDLTAFRADRGDLVRYALYILAAAVLIGLLRYVWRRCLIGTSRRVEEGLRNRLFSHIQTLSAAYFDTVTTGDLMAHATNDIQHIRMATGMGIVALTDAVVLGTAAIAFMAYIDLTLTLYVLIPMPLIIFGTRLFSRKLHQRYLSVQGTFADLTEAVRERFAGIRMVKAHNGEQTSAARVEEISRAYIRDNLHLVAIIRSLFPLMVFFSNVSLAIILYRGGRDTIRGVITPGDFVAFISYLGLLTWPMMAMGWVTNLIQRGRASLDRIDAVLSVRPAIATPAAPEPFRIREDGGDGGAAVSLRGVSFAYPASAQTATGHRAAEPVLSDIDVTVPGGEVLGIVGPPGSGKSTLLSLIPRLYDPTAGSVHVNGSDIRRLNLEDLRSRIAFVPQEPFMFAGTVRENITFDDPAVTAAALADAVEQASLTETVQAFPAGLETVVGEKGVILSGGQKQRIALARALVRNAPLMIFDDPISQVDTETGRVIIETIRSLAGSRTVLIVSHRLSAVRFADRIICLSEGCVVESGSHRTLMAAGGYYANTLRLQAVEESFHAS